MKARHPQGDNTPTVNVSPFERVASTGIGGYLLYDAIANKGKWGWVKAVGGALLLYRGVSGYCPAYGAMGRSQLPVPYKTINIRTKLTVNKPRSEVYTFWRKLENLPLFMKHLESVEKIDEKYSNWKAKFPGQPMSIEWKAEIVKEREGEFIGWSSTEDATIKNAGKVEFKEALGGRGTEINVVIAYHPPMGIVGSGIAKLFNKKVEKMIRKDIQNFKSYIETGVNEKTGSGITNPNVTKTAKDLKKEKKAVTSEPTTTSHDLIKGAAQGLAEGLENNPGERVFGQL
jgi:uncharacterized membrane protein